MVARVKKRMLLARVSRAARRALRISSCARSSTCARARRRRRRCRGHRAGRGGRDPTCVSLGADAPEADGSAGAPTGGRISLGRLKARHPAAAGRGAARPHTRQSRGAWSQFSLRAVPPCEATSRPSVRSGDARSAARASPNPRRASLQVARVAWHAHQRWTAPGTSSFLQWWRDEPTIVVETQATACASVCP